VIEVFVSISRSFPDLGSRLSCPTLTWFCDGNDRTALRRIISKLNQSPAPSGSNWFCSCAATCLQATTKDYATEAMSDSLFFDRPGKSRLTGYGFRYASSRSFRRFAFDHYRTPQ